MAETKKKTTTAKKTTANKKTTNTNKKTTSTKKSTTTKATSNKSTATKKPVAKKNTNTKKNTQLKEYDIKKTVAKKPVKKQAPKAPVVPEVVVPVEEAKPIVHPMSEPNYEEVKVEQPVVVEPVVTVNKPAKKDKLIDTGILVVIIGLFILLVTTYLATTLSLTNTVTKILVGVSLVTELTGIILIIIGSVKKD